MERRIYENDFFYIIRFCTERSYNTIYEYILYLNFFKKYDVIYFSTLTGSPAHLSALTGPALLSHSLSFCLIYIFSLYFILHVAQYFHYLQICCTCMFPNSTHTHTHTLLHASIIVLLFIFI